MVLLQLIHGALSNGLVQRFNLMSSLLHRLVLSGVQFQVCINACNLSTFSFTAIQVNYDISSNLKC
jgi:hypothetical protein